jgi:hypothetical protein
MSPRCAGIRDSEISSICPGQVIEIFLYFEFPEAWSEDFFLIMEPVKSKMLLLKPGYF